jgi:hypothetical protein
MDVRRPLAAVSQVVKAGHRVVFDSEENGGSYIENTGTGKRHKVYERGGIYVLPAWVEPSSGASLTALSQPGFARQVHP